MYSTLQDVAVNRHWLRSPASCTRRLWADGVGNTTRQPPGTGAILGVFDSKSRRTRSIGSGLLFQPSGKRSQYERPSWLRALQAAHRLLALCGIGAFQVSVTLAGSAQQWDWIRACTRRSGACTANRRQCPNDTRPAPLRARITKPLACFILSMLKWSATE